MPPKQDQINSRKLTRDTGTSLAVHWSRLHVSTAGGSGLIPGQETKILHAMSYGPKKRNNT